MAGIGLLFAMWLGRRLANSHDSLIDTLKDNDTRSTDTLIAVKDSMQEVVRSHVDTHRSMEIMQSDIKHSQALQFQKMETSCSSIDELVKQHNDPDSPFSTMRLIDAIPEALQIVEIFADSNNLDIKEQISTIKLKFRRGI